MTQHYSTRAFFRQMPNGFLARYFAVREVLADFDFKAMKEPRLTHCSMPGWSRRKRPAWAWRANCARSAA